MNFAIVHVLSVKLNGLVSRDLIVELKVASVLGTNTLDGPWFEPRERECFFREFAENEMVFFSNGLAGAKTVFGTMKGEFVVDSSMNK